MVLKLENEKIIVTSALPYANGPIHLGHLSGAYLPADIFVRYKRLTKSDIIYVCGSDEHGVPITITADKEKLTPQDIINRYHESNKAAFAKFGMSFDIYSRTSIPTHHQTAQDFFMSYNNQGILTEKKTLQFYDEKAGMFLPDRYVEGTCPKCGYEEARSDECEKCGDLYDPSELINPKSKISGGTPELKETSHWYFPLGKYQERLEKYINEANEKFNWKDNVLNYCKGWFKDGLKDRAVTRDLDWGVKVPLENADAKVLYVWFEAVLGYISATKELFKEKNNPEGWKEYWQNEKTRYIAFIGKDNIVFHTIIFPAMLMAWNDTNDEKFVLPENVPANEFLNFEGKKFSKSRGWGIDVEQFLEIFPADSLRYTLAANLPENKDTDFYWKEFQAKSNSELADILGNFINRTFIFASKHFDEKVPERGELETIDKEMLALISEAPKKIGNLIEKYKIRDAVFEMMSLARAGNKYFNDSEPWVSVKNDKTRTATTVNICLKTIYTLAEVFSPVIPFSSEKIFKMLNVKSADWNEIGKTEFEVGHQLNKSEILFTKIEDKTIDAEILKWSNPATVEEKEEEKFPEITFEDFMKVDLKVAEIIAAENVKRSKKLLKLQVKIGKTERQVVAGIAQSYKPESLVGKKVVMVANLKPAILFGLESQGMILAIEDENGKLNVVEVNNSLNSGLKVR
ncbi:MAG: methionine--tRNA ligase [Bacteroidetes bacterium]|nr:methionine--tRNA ligase [Bacteroidota bacterium]MBU1114696.1 methionine--tRNA ligase [Bacteroidota bacterium]MBU1798898.1 methionine--tRNA ligase [Bacteroidota bacterium]